VTTYYGKILALYNFIGSDNCWALFADGIGWKRLAGGPSPESNTIFAVLAAEAKSDNRFVFIYFSGDDVSSMYVF
jgi:hypothetical protein